MLFRSVFHDEINRENSLLIFISHRWLRGWSGAEGWTTHEGNHPDNANHDKFHLVMEAIEKIKKCLTSDFEKIYYWIDYTCVDQDNAPATELKHLETIISLCDLILTPLHDPEIEIDFNSTDLFTRYKSLSWDLDPNKFSYLQRGWTRIEMFYAANVPFPVSDSSNRLAKFKAGLHAFHQQGRRPHLIYSTKDREYDSPQILPPLRNSFFNQYHPGEGSFTDENDRQLMYQWIEDLKHKYIFNEKIGYFGPVNQYKQSHGKGIFIDENGSRYIGDWWNGMRHGKGTCIYYDGKTYDGEGQLDKMDGKGELVYSSGERYVGDWVRGCQEGFGVYYHADGSVGFSGKWENNQRISLVANFYRAISITSSLDSEPT